MTIQIPSFQKREAAALGLQIRRQKMPSSLLRWVFCVVVGISARWYICCCICLGEKEFCSVDPLLILSLNSFTDYKKPQTKQKSPNK